MAEFVAPSSSAGLTHSPDRVAWTGFTPPVKLSRRAALPASLSRSGFGHSEIFLAVSLRATFDRKRRQRGNEATGQQGTGVGTDKPGRADNLRGWQRNPPFAVQGAPGAPCGP